MIGTTSVARPRLSSSARSPRRPLPKRKDSPGDDDLGADRLEVGARELLRLERGYLRRELDDERLLDAELREQLQPALERREQRHLVAEHLPGMRMEGDDRRRRTMPDRGPDDRPVPDVDAVERADRDRARPPLELARRVRDVHSAASSASTRSRTASGTRATASAGSRASASATAISRSESASSTANGPTAVRRSAVQ